MVVETQTSPTFNVHIIPTGEKHDIKSVTESGFILHQQKIATWDSSQQFITPFSQINSR